MKRRLTAMLLLLALLLTMAPGALAASSPAVTNNLNDHNYTYNRWANPVNSYLVDNGDATYTRVEYTGEAVAVETYDTDLKFTEGFTVDMELPIFGGFYSGETCNFLIFGQQNPDEDDAVEVIRVVSYTKDWERIDAASLYGANTYIPFDAGSLRCAEYGGYLYIRTAHEMYASSDGLHHQANMTLNVRISDMTVTDSFSEVMNVNYGYVSHSFNQFIAIDGTDIMAVDHGDAHPRSVVLTKYNAPAGQDSFMEYRLVPVGNGYYTYAYTEYVEVLPIMGSTGANDTGVALGGFEISNSHYLIAGTTVPQDDTYDAFGQRNIFITATSKEDFSAGGTAINYLTSYIEEDSVTLSNPHFIKVEDGKYAAIWTETASGSTILRLAYVDGSGNLIGDVQDTEGVLSDCVPIVSNGKLIWYVTRASAPSFFTMDLSHPGTISHDHLYTYSYSSHPGYSREGSLSSQCVICGVAGENVTIPAIKDSDEYSIYQVINAPTCTTAGSGYYLWNKAADYGISQYWYSGTIPALGHDMTYTEGVAGTCVAQGTSEHWDCSRCGLRFADEAGTTELTDLTVPIDPDNHTGRTELVGVVEATCTQAGYTGDTVCSDCGEVVAQGTQTDPTEHEYSDHVCVNCGATDSPAPGDLNQDYALTVSDIILLKQLILSADISSDVLPLADVNGDGSVSVSDIICLKNIILAG